MKLSEALDTAQLLVDALKRSIRVVPRVADSDAEIYVTSISCEFIRNCEMVCKAVDVNDFQIMDFGGFFTQDLAGADWYIDLDKDTHDLLVSLRDAIQRLALTVDFDTGKGVIQVPLEYYYDRYR